MDQTREARQMLARRSGLQFLRGLNNLARNLPHPHGTTLRITVTVIDTGEDLGSVDVDATNASDLGFLASRRNPSARTTPAKPLSGRPALHVVGGAR